MTESRAYYSENDRYAAAWLRNLIAGGLIAPGDVDERSIVDVRPADLKGYTQCHFFAGIAGWSYALRLAGWADSRPVWTGSCPCQPFSSAGARKGFDDARHLWPVWERLIAECCPPTIFGEQVTRSADWLRLVRSDLDALGYAVGCMPVEAASVGADHVRDRYWFVADADRKAESVCAFNAEVAATPQSASDIDESRFPRGGEARAHSEDARDVDTGHRFGDNAARIISREHWTHQPVVGGHLHGIPGRMDAVRAFGNAIVPQAGAAFVRAFLDSEAAGHAFVDLADYPDTPRRLPLTLDAI